MPIAPLEFLESAKRLAALPDEADHRSAISRGYYSAYHPASGLASSLPDHHNMTGRGGVHEQLAKKLSEFPMTMKGFSQDECRSIRSAGIMLNQLKTQRRDADYELGKLFTQTDAASLLIVAERLLKKLNTIASSRAPSSAATA